MTFRRSTGQFDYQDMTKLCVCGHRLGEHGINPGERRCFECKCPKFRPKRRKKGR